MIDGSETTTDLPHDINLVHRDSEVFLGGSYDTRLLTQSYINTNFYGTIQKVHNILLLCEVQSKGVSGVLRGGKGGFSEGLGWTMVPSKRSFRCQ